MHLDKKKWMTFHIMFLCIFCTNASAATLIYKYTVQEKDYIVQSVITKTNNGFLIKGTDNATKAEHILNTNSSFSNLKWKFTDPDKGIDTIAERTGNEILLTGQYNYKKTEEKYKIDGLPWFQDWGLGLIEFLNSDKTSALFWSIDPGKLRIAKFEARKEKTEKISVNSKEVESVYVKIGLTGFLKMFWSGDMWFRKSDGKYILSKMTNGPNTPVAIVQLTEEK